MNTTAAHLVDRVFPEVPVRQRVLSLPMWLRFLVAWDGELCRRVLGTYLERSGHPPEDLPTPSALPICDTGIPC